MSSRGRFGGTVRGEHGHGDDDDDKGEGSEVEGPLEGRQMAPGQSGPNVAHLFLEPRMGPRAKRQARRAETPAARRYTRRNTVPELLPFNI